MPDKRRTRRPKRSPEKTRDPMLPNPLPQQLQPRHPTPRLLRRLERINRRQQHPESGRRDRGRQCFHQDGPGEGFEQGKDAGVGGGISEA